VRFEEVALVEMFDAGEVTRIVGKFRHPQLTYPTTPTNTHALAESSASCSRAFAGMP
jgi:hypothetical protein